MLTSHRRSIPHVVRFIVAGMVASALLWGTKQPADARAPQYHVRVVQVLGEASEEVKQQARDLLQKEFRSREMFGSDSGESAGSERGHRSFHVTLRLEELSKELKEPRVGRRMKQLAVVARISVLGSDVADSKLAFSGEGESTLVVEVDERRLEKEASGLVADVLADAITQAVDQAVAKLSAAKSSTRKSAPKAKSNARKPPTAKKGPSETD